MIFSFKKPFDFFSSGLGSTVIQLQRELPHHLVDIYWKYNDGTHPIHRNYPKTETKRGRAIVAWNWYVVSFERCFRLKTTLKSRFVLEWSQGISTTATRCVTFSDETQVGFYLDIASSNKRNFNFSFSLVVPRIQTKNVTSMHVFMGAEKFPHMLFLLHHITPLSQEGFKGIQDQETTTRIPWTRTMWVICREALLLTG